MLKPVLAMIVVGLTPRHLGHIFETCRHTATMSVYGGILWMGRRWRRRRRASMDG